MLDLKFTKRADCEEADMVSGELHVFIHPAFVFRLTNDGFVRLTASPSPTSRTASFSEISHSRWARRNLGESPECMMLQIIQTAGFALSSTFSPSQVKRNKLGTKILLPSSLA